MKPSTNAIAELHRRKDWALALISELVHRGRAAAWLPGEATALIDADAVLGDLAEPGASPMQLLASRLELTALELDLLWLLACIELDPHVATAAQLLVPPGLNELSAQMLERLVGRGEVLDCDVFDRLERLALIHNDERLALNRRPIRVNERVLDLARGRLAMDRRLRGIAALEDVLEVRRWTTDDIELPSELRGAGFASPRPLVVVTGTEGSGRATLLLRAAAACDRSLILVDARELATEEVALVQQLRAVVRECRLHDAWPLVREVDCLSDRRLVLGRELVSALDAPIFATARDACTWSIARPIVTIPLSIADAPARASIWRRALPAAGDDVVLECARRYAISPGMIMRGGAAVSALVSEPVRVDVSHVHRALRTQFEQRLVRIARRIETRQTWNDLVLPVDQFDLLIELVARVRHKQRVLDDWGFADKVGRGLGLSALLSGPPGTGKTMIAGLVAQELGLDLYQVDLSKVVSKYIGETEKQLAALFEAAESGHAILLFDEADSLFAKRTEVKSSNDRYANLEVNYLLQRIEAFTGITLLTTNHDAAIDKAFLRRLAFHIRVPMPDERQRELLWRTMLPDRADCSDDVDFAGLAATFVMSGGYVRNAALRAAFLSAEQGTSITNAQLWRAARAEYDAMGKVSCQPISTKLSAVS